MYEETKAHVIRDKAYEAIKNGEKVYKSIFTEEYAALDEDEKAYVAGSIMSDFAWDFKGFVDLCISERTGSSLSSTSVVVK
ncbi:hypothetical protein [Bacillus sp. OTU530]|uniref:hypothetical protein n=1 Tax=Bacillus sp. OTU530 TaxID=3043862 RepID=UPI00313EDF75